MSASNTVQILYNGIDAFYPYPTPFVGIGYNEIYYGELWAKEEVMTLQGEITGCNFDALMSGKNQLLNNFNQSYQTLQVWETDNGISGLVFQKQLTEIQSIDFSSSSWRGAENYSITLKCYPSGYFSGAFGILQPSDTWSFKESANEIINVTHKVSCRGFNTSSSSNNSIDNARQWVAAKTGWNNEVAPAFISGFYSQNLTLLTLNEEINRFDGTYSVTENYVLDSTRSGYGTIRYNTSFESGNNLITVKLQGELQGSPLDIQSTRQQFSGLNLLALASNSYFNAFGYNDLNPNYVKAAVSEDAYQNRISFDYDYDNDPNPESVMDYTVSLKSGSNITASLKGEVFSRGGDTETRFIKSKNYLANLDLYSLTNQFYNQFYPFAVSFPLNPNPVVHGVNFDEYNGRVSVDIQYSNARNFGSNFEYFQYTAQFEPAAQKFNAQSVLDGNLNLQVLSVVDLGYKNRAALTIAGSAKTIDSVPATIGVQSVRDSAVTLLSQLGSFNNVILEEDRTELDKSDQRMITFSFKWSFDSFNNVVSIGNYGTISSLNV